MKLLIGDFVRTAILILFLLALKMVNAQVYNFTTAGATGSVGPTQSQLNSAYLNTNLNNVVSSNNGIQSWTVPVTGPYKITAIGARGAGNGGYGAKVEGRFNLTAGQVLNMVVGQRGENGSGAAYSNNGGGGGGGSFVVIGIDSLLLAAGGGGGGLPNAAGGNASTLTLGGSTLWDGAGNDGNGGYSGITNGDAAGGGGFYTNGSNSNNSSQSVCEGGKAFVNGAQGGASGTNGIYYGGCGGFGGGGSGWHNGINRGGAGGGYSGGQGGTLSASIGGGGGGSFNVGEDQNNTEAVGAGDGSIVLLLLKEQPVDVAPNITISGTCAANTPTPVASATSTFENENDSEFNIFPNPSNGVFKLNISTKKNIDYSIFDLHGKLVKQLSSKEQYIEFNLSELPNGLYLLKVGDLATKKIVKV